MGGEVESPHVDQPVVGHWGNIIDPLNTTWVCPDGTPYNHNEASVPREDGGSPDLLDAKFEEGSWFDAWAGHPDVHANLRAWGGPYVDLDGVPYTSYNEEE
jgi:hypothetical protein